MKNLLLTIFSIFSVLSFAQIEITTNDLPSPGDTNRVSIAILPDSIDYVTTGANQTWDFSFLEPEQQYVDSFMTVAETGTAFSFTFSFPLGDATMAQPEVSGLTVGTLELEDMVSFYKNAASEYEMQGYGAYLNGLPIPVKYDDAERIYSFPINYLDTDSDYFEYGTEIPNVGYYGQSGVRETEIDGWGSVTTPYGTFDALRVKVKLAIRDTIAYTGFPGFAINRPIQYEYKWITNDEKIPVLKIQTTEIAGEEIVNAIEYRDNYVSGLLAVSPKEKNKVIAFPNPTKDWINIGGMSNNSKTIEIFNAAGALVYSMQSQNIQEKIFLAPLNLEAGHYIISISQNGRRSVHSFIYLN